MFKLDKTVCEKPGVWDYDFDFWPNQAAQLFEQKEYSKTIEICEKNLDDNSPQLSARLIYARTLLELGKQDEASEQFYYVLSADPDNLVALKYLGDIHYKKSDVVSAMASYSRVLQIDPFCRGLKSDLKIGSKPVKSKVKIVKTSESKQTIRTQSIGAPFATESMADLYLSQGQPRLALDILKDLIEKNGNPRLNEKLSEAEKLVSQKENKNVG